MEKNASVVGWLKGALKLRKANTMMNQALARGMKYQKAISPNLQKSVATQYTEALKATSGAKNLMKQEAAGGFGILPAMKNFPGNLYSKFYKPVIKRGRGRPLTNPKLKKGAPQQTAGRVNSKGVTPPEGMPTPPTTGEPFSKKWNLKGMAIGGIGGYAAGRMLGGGSSSEQDYYQGYPVKYASYGTSMKKLLKGVGRAVKNKYVIGAGVVGTGVGYGTAKLTDNHTKADHMPYKYAADMTPKEKADQKYAIAKSYENEGHPRKAKEYKDKASKAYKRAWEKRASAVGSTEYNLASIWHVGTFNTSSTAKKSNYRAKLLDKDKEGYNYIQVFDKKSNKPYKTWKVVPGEGKDDSPAVLLQEQKRVLEKKSNKSK